MEKLRLKRLFISFGVLFLVLFTGCSADDLPLENQCQPFIEKAINDLKKENVETTSVEEGSALDSRQTENISVESHLDHEEINSKEESEKLNSIENNSEHDTDENTIENITAEENRSSESPDNDNDEEEHIEQLENELLNDDDENNYDNDDETIRNKREVDTSDENDTNNEMDLKESSGDDNEDSQVVSLEVDQHESIPNEDELQETTEIESTENETKAELNLPLETAKISISEEESTENEEIENESIEPVSVNEDTNEQAEEEEKENEENGSLENEKTDNDSQPNKEESEEDNKSVNDDQPNIEEASVETVKTHEDKKSSETDESEENKTEEKYSVDEEESERNDDSEQNNANDDHPEEDLLLEFNVPTNLRDRSHIDDILNLGESFSNTEIAVNKAADIILRDLKRIYDSAIKPLETVYKYRDLSNRHFGDAEIFSKPLVLLMGPWSGGKSTVLNYLSENEYTSHSIRSGAEPSPAYFNILMYGDEPEVLDGTQLAADWTFSGLQKFGQGMLDRLRGLKLKNELLKKVNLIEIPGLLEVRKQVSRLFPFNDACQWFIDRADIILLVYDPSKLDVGPETEAILDQLKGREYQTRILLNKADTVKPEELLRVQSALIWNISPLMSSANPPTVYTVSLWSHPYREGAPTRLLQAQERALLKDLQEAIEKRIENKIASARRFAVRIRNHAKMVDCYLTTYYNHKTLFGNKKQISDHIIENPSHYHIYEGLSTLTNISRYDLPNEDAYRDFFKLNPLYNFKRLAETCTYFKGCPINQLDIAISYQLPELAGKYKKILEQELAKIDDVNKG